MDDIRQSGGVYVPEAGDFVFLSRQDINVDHNFASQGYWKGVLIHFFRNKRAVTGLVIVLLITILAVFGPMLSSYGYKEIISGLSETGKQITAGQTWNQSFWGFSTSAARPA